MNGAEMLCGSYGASNAINVLIISALAVVVHEKYVHSSVSDDEAWVWYRAPSGSDPSADCTDQMVIRRMQMGLILFVHPRMPSGPIRGW